MSDVPENRVDARIVFSFKGETHDLATTIDLDALLRQGELPESLHPWLARQHGIDTYSYLYEVMEASEIEFSNAHGLAAAYLSDDFFDLAGFFSGAQESRLKTALAEIARREMGLQGPHTLPGLEQALLAAYHLGRTRLER